MAINNVRNDFNSLKNAKVFAYRIVADAVHLTGNQRGRVMRFAVYRSEIGMLLQGIRLGMAK